MKTKIKNSFCCNGMRSAITRKELLLSTKDDGEIIIALPASTFFTGSEQEIYRCPFCGEEIVTELVKQN